MHNDNTQSEDEWDEKLEVKISELKKCQENEHLPSCTPCPKFFDCELRKSYVSAVYESMNKGSTGGFEF